MVNNINSLPDKLLRHIMGFTFSTFKYPFPYSIIKSPFIKDFLVHVLVLSITTHQITSLVLLTALLLPPPNKLVPKSLICFKKEKPPFYIMASITGLPLEVLYLILQIPSNVIIRGAWQSNGCSYLHILFVARALNCNSRW